MNSKTVAEVVQQGAKIAPSPKAATEQSDVGAKACTLFILVGGSKAASKRALLRGHYQYYGISGNRRAIERYHYVTKRLVFKWINRRSRKTSFNWKGFQCVFGALSTA